MTRLAKAGLLAASVLSAAISAGAVPGAALAGQWIKVQSRHLTIYSENDEKMVRAYVRHMEGFNLAADQLFTAIGDSQLETSRRQTFYYMATLREFKLVKPSIPDNAFNPELTCADYGPSFFSVMEPFNADTVDRKYISPDLAYLMRSYTGVKIAEYFSEPPPVWLRAGLQDYFMTMNIDKGDAIVGLPLSDMITQTDTTAVSATAFRPIDEVVSGAAMAAKDGQVARIEQWVLVSQLLSTAEGRGKLANYLERLRNGEDTVAAFHAATGIDDEGLKETYKRYMSKGVPVLTYHMDIKADSDITVTPLSSYGRAVPLMLASLRTCPPRKHGESLLSDLRGLSAKFPQDELVVEATSLAEIDFGDPERARAPLDSRLTANPQDTDALLQKGRMTMKIGDAAGGEARHARYTEARQILGKAYTLEPANAQILYTFSRASRDLPTYPDDNTLNAAELANNYSAGAYGVYVAELYARRGRYDDALAALEPWITGSRDPEYRAAMTKIVTALKAHAATEDLIALFTAYNGLE